METGHDNAGREQRDVSPVAAFVDVVQSSQDVVLRRLDVLRLEAERRLEGLRDETIGLAFAAVLAMSAWLLLLAAAVVFLSREIGLGWALLALGGVNLLLAAIAQRVARSRADVTEPRGEHGRQG